MLLSIVVPVYNSGVLEELAGRIDAALAAQPDIDYEVIFIDDCSPRPEVWATLERLARGNRRVRALQLTRNFGQQAATLCGLREARGDFVITIDDDLQHDPADIPSFLEHRNHDIVIAQFSARRHGLLRRGESRLKGAFDRLIIGNPRNVRMSSYRMLSRTVVDGILSIRTPHPFIPALMFYVSRDAVGVPAAHNARREGRTGYRLPTLLGVFSNLLINNSSLILRIVGQLGIGLAGLSFLIAAFVVYRKLAYGVAVRGWTSLFATLLLIGGLLLFGLGVVGEYLIRIIEGTETRPTYLVRRRVESGA
jgi:glycosyltransferase involved in cell wall biosynthesis